MIRKDRGTDAESILEIWHKASTLAHPFLEQAFVEKVRKDMIELYIPNADTWVYEENGEILGFIGMIENEIGGLFVLPTHHSKGIGTQLVNIVRTRHKTLEVEVFKANQIGRAFYDKYGFKTFKEFVQEETNQEVLRMRLK